MSPLRTGSRAELFRALGVLVEPPAPEQARVADLLGLPRPDGTDWTEAFVVQLVPYASVYLSADGMLGGEPADRVAGFWRALRLRPPADPDHLAALLGLYATLVEAEQAEPDGPGRALRRQARAALLQEHLLSWLLPYLHAMAEVGPAPYVSWAGLLRDVLAAEATEVGRSTQPASHLRELSVSSAEPSGLDELATGLLSPARSGIVLTRGHLGTAARALGLGSRLGERRRVLRSLVEQDPAGVLGRLAEHADLWVSRHRADVAVAGIQATYWADRASATAGQLRAYEAVANEEVGP
jgi:TorA maturation chaperone TorD